MMPGKIGTEVPKKFVKSDTLEVPVIAALKFDANDFIQKPAIERVLFEEQS